MTPIAASLPVVALTALALTGCSQSGTPGGDATPPSTGTITGVVTLTGGPVGEDGKPAIRHERAANWPVSVRSEEGETLSTTTDGLGNFTFEVEPGTYTLNCLRVEKLEVVAGSSVDSKCVVPVP